MAQQLAIPQSGPLAEEIWCNRDADHSDGPLPPPPKSAVFLCRRCVHPTEGTSRPESDCHKLPPRGYVDCSGLLAQRIDKYSISHRCPTTPSNPEFVGERRAAPIDPAERGTAASRSTSVDIDAIRRATQCARPIPELQGQCGPTSLRRYRSEFGRFSRLPSAFCRISGSRNIRH